MFSIFIDSRILGPVRKCMEWPGYESVRCTKWRATCLARAPTLFRKCCHVCGRRRPKPRAGVNFGIAQWTENMDRMQWQRKQQLSDPSIHNIPATLDDSNWPWDERMSNEIQWDGQKNSLVNITTSETSRFMVTQNCLKYDFVILCVYVRVRSFYLISPQLRSS